MRITRCFGALPSVNSEVKRVNNEENRRICFPIMQRVVASFVLQTIDNSAPGPDGFPTSFYHENVKDS